jgi:hypothetical protein
MSPGYNFVPVECTGAILRGDRSIKCWGKYAGVEKLGDLNGRELTIVVDSSSVLYAK